MEFYQPSQSMKPSSSSGNESLIWYGWLDIESQRLSHDS